MRLSYNEHYFQPRRSVLRGLSKLKSPSTHARRGSPKTRSVEARLSASSIHKEEDFSYFTWRGPFGFMWLSVGNLRRNDLRSIASTPPGPLQPPGGLHRMDSTGAGPRQVAKACDQTPPFNHGQPCVRQPRGSTRVTPEEPSEWIISARPRSPGSGRN